MVLPERSGRGSQKRNNTGAEFEIKLFWLRNTGINSPLKIEDFFLIRMALSKECGIRIIFVDPDPYRYGWIRNPYPYQMIRIRIQLKIENEK